MNGSSAWLRRAGGLALVAICLTLMQAQTPSSRPGFSIELTEPENQSVVVGKTMRSESAEHSDPHRAGPADPRGFRGGQGFRNSVC